MPTLVLIKPLALTRGRVDAWTCVRAFMLPSPPSLQTMREAENQNVKEIQKQIGKLERLLREEALADG